MTDDVVSKIKDAFEDIFDDKKTLIKIITVALILIIALVLRISGSYKSDITVESADPAEETELENEQEADQADDAGIIYVDIGGAVINPGVYQVAYNTRLYQVIDMAGGLADDADTDSVNQASFVEDGQKIIIPVKGSGSVVSPGDTSSSGINATGLVNINTASADELKTLNGIGDVMAERIIEYRSSKPFKSIEEIMSVDGIGQKIFEKIKDQITC